MRQNLTQSESSILCEYRRDIYENLFKSRCDSQFELIDALLHTGGMKSFPELSQSKVFRREWCSAYSAVEDGQQNTEWLFTHAAQQAPHEGVCVFALDVSSWRRMDADTMEGRQYVHQASQAINHGDVSVGYAYSWLEYVPEAHRSWTLPVNVGRVPVERTALEYGAEQVKALCQARKEYRHQLDIVAADGTYGTCRFLALVQDLPCGIVTRLRRDRTLRRRPDPQRHHQTKHGAEFKFKDATTWDAPVDLVELPNVPCYGQVRLRRWNHLHDVMDAGTEFDVLLIEAHLERHKPSEPYWLAWKAPQGITSPVSVGTLDIWHAYDGRGAIEPSFRFRKQHLMWTTPQFSTPDAGDRWTIMIFSALWQLHLARPLVEDCPRPWHKPQPVHAMTPRRVHLSFASLASEIGTPTRPPQTRGLPPGWVPGRPRTKHPRCPVIKKQRKHYLSVQQK